METCEAHSCASRVAAARQALGMSPAELSRRSGVSKAQISRLESGQMPRPPVTTLAPIARALGVTTDYLLSGDCPPSEADLPADLRQQISLMPPEYRELVGELIAQGHKLPDSPEGRAAFQQAIRVAVGYLQSVIERDKP